MRQLAAALAPALPLMLAACGSGSSSGASATADAGRPTMLMLTVASANGSHRFQVEQASTEAQQARGLMYRTAIPADGGMLFWPYPPEGPPREASFWMKNTPSPLDIVFIRADGVIARIAENTTPFSETPVTSGEPVAAVLEIRGGLALELGIDEGDKVSWPGQKK